MTDFTKPIQTRGGEKVRILCTDAPGDYPIVGLIGGNHVPETWTAKGYHLNWDETPHVMDLVNIPETKTFWLNVYPDWVGAGYPTRESAVDRADPNSFGVLKTDITDDNVSTEFFPC